MDHGKINRCGPGFERYEYRACGFGRLRFFSNLVSRLSIHSRPRLQTRIRIPKRLRLPPRICLSRYSDADSAATDSISTLGHEPIRIPAYESHAKTGRRAPHRFECRGRWYRVVDTGVIWKDSRPQSSSNASGHTYFSVATADGLQFHLTYKPAPKRRENGSWTVYRKVTYRPISRSTAELSRH